jgi:hypothetical protein
MRPSARAINPAAMPSSIPAAIIAKLAFSPQL